MPKVTEAHLQARKEQIMEATFRCISRKGYSRTTVRDIAREAGLSLGTLYLYFENKEEIVSALSASWREKTDRKLEESFPEGSPLEILCTIFELVIRKYNSPQAEEVMRVDLQLWAESLNHPELRVNIVEALGDRISQFSRLITEAQRNGEISADLEERALARVFMALLIGLEVQKSMEPDLDMEALHPVIRSLLRCTSAK
jgi:AcrR family transcriptional regulator